MSDNPAVEPTDPTGAAPEAVPIQSEAPAQEPAIDWKAEARKWEQRAKENSAAAKRLAELEEAAKTEEQKRAEELEALRSKVAEYETREQINAWKAEVSKETGVPAAVLAGNTLEEIQAHAESLEPLITPSAQPAAAAVPTIGNQPDRPAQSVPLKDQIAAAEAAGDKALVATLKAMQLGSVQ